MPKKTGSGKARTPKKNQTQPTIPDQRGLEKGMADLHKLLQSRNFGSIDEANAFLKEMFAANAGQIPEVPASELALEQAQDVMYQAWNARGAQRVRLANKALELSPDCADAYVLLAEETAKTPEEAKELYQQGVNAGERAIGARNFKEYVGHFWGILETRPYMRARLGLAESLWYLGEHAPAIGHAQEMLRLNPGDNQGIRYILVNWLLETNNLAALDRLLKQYPDDGMATWNYTQALTAFRQEGASANANALLTAAIKQNRFVPPYLLGTKKLPRTSPAFMGFGDENEAVDYAFGAIKIWLNDPAALEWLRNFITTSSLPTSS